MIAVIIPKLGTWTIIISLLIIIAILYLLAKNYKNKLKAYKEYSNQNWTQYSRNFFWLGLISSILIVFLAASWTLFDPVSIAMPRQKFRFDDLGMADVQMNTKPVLPAAPPPSQPLPPPIKPPVIKEVIKPVVTTPVIQTPPIIPPTTSSTTSPSQSSQSTSNDNSTSQSNGSEKALQIVENMPLFPGCEKESKPIDREECTRRMLSEFIQQNLKYPELAIKNNTQGKVTVQFVVEKDGMISEIKVFKDIGDGTGIAALEAVKALNGMSQRIKPGSQGGKTVRVKYNIPINFSLRQKAAKAN